MAEYKPQAIFRVQIITEKINHVSDANHSKVGPKPSTFSKGFSKESINACPIQMMIPPNHSPKKIIFTISELLPPVINHSTLAYVWHYPGQTATSHQPFHPGLCGSLSRGRLPSVINHSTLSYHYMCGTIQGQTATRHQAFHPGLRVPLSRGRLPPVINHSTLSYHYMCGTIQVQTATSHQPFHPGLCVSLSRGRLPSVINHSTLAYMWHYPGPSWLSEKSRTKASTLP